MTDFETELLARLSSIESKVDDLRTKDIPSLRTKVEVLKEKSRNTAAIISSIGVGIGTIISVAMARYKQDAMWPTRTIAKCPVCRLILGTLTEIGKSSFVCPECKWVFSFDSKGNNLPPIQVDQKESKKCKCESCKARI